MKRVDLGVAGNPVPGREVGQGTMRGKIIFAFAVVTTAVACGHTGSGGVPSRAPVDARAAGGGAAAGPPQYVVADPSPRSNVVALRLGSGGALGLVVDKTRIVVGRGEPHVGSDVPEAPLAGVRPIPSRIGGGYVFWTENDVYRADAFDAPLKPIARFADAIQNMSFAPKFLLVRTSNGERWALGLPSGERVPMDPLGASDVEGLDDGRALSFNDQGAAFSSMDGGAHWVDVTSQIKSSPTRVAVIDDELWLFESSGGALRLEPDGQLSIVRQAAARAARRDARPRPALARRRGAAARRVPSRRVDRREHRDRRRAGRPRARRRPHGRDRRHRLGKAPAGRAMRGRPHVERRALRVRLARRAAVGRLTERVRRLAHALR